MKTSLVLVYTTYVDLPRTRQGDAAGGVPHHDRARYTACGIRPWPCEA